MRLIALLLALCLVVGCAGSPTSGGAARAVAQAQSMLVFPVIGLGEALVQSQRQLDRIRHEVPRGQAMKAALGEYATQVAQLRAATTQVSTLAQRLDRRNPVVREAAVTVERLLALASAVSGVAESEAAVYNRFADIDMAMDGIVAGWDQAGSLSELRITLRRLSAQAADLAQAAGDISPAPAACATPRDSRVRWGTLLKIRTDQLAELVTTRTGLQYDVLRDQFRPQPYGEDRLAVDAATRQCWLTYSLVAHTEQQALAGVARLRELLVS